MKLSREIRALIYRLHILLEFDANRIHELIFESFAHVPLTLSYLSQLCRKLNQPQFAEWYLMGPRHSSGRPNLLSSDEVKYLTQLTLNHKIITLRQMREDFKINYLGLGIHEQCPISISTMCRILQRSAITLKKYPVAIFDLVKSKHLSSLKELGMFIQIV